VFEHLSGLFLKKGGKIMFQRTWRIVLGLIVILIVVSVQTAMAQDKPMPELKAEDFTVTAYEELFLKEVAGVFDSLRQEGTIFLALNMLILPQWTEQAKTLEIKDKDIKLVAPDGKEFPMIGYFDRLGQFKLTTKSLYVSRSSNWQESPQKAYYNVGFAVPKDGQKYQFKLGSLTMDIEKPAQIEKTIDHGKTISVEILSSRLVDEVQNTYKVGEQKFETTATIPYGKFLEVKIKLTPVIGNIDPTHFFWYTPWFWALCDNGTYTPILAEHFMGNFSTGVSHNLSYSNNKWNSSEATLYFSVPENTKSLTLIYINSPVANQTIP
jgi:hypothetical protein